jgi:hypothetical protein
MAMSLERAQELARGPTKSSTWAVAKTLTCRRAPAGLLYSKRNPGIESVESKLLKPEENYAEQVFRHGFKHFHCFHALVRQNTK